MNKITLGINVCANDWTAKRVIISSNGGGGGASKEDYNYECFPG